MVGTLMGKLHSASLGHQPFRERFPNEGHIRFWNGSFFTPLYDTLRDPHVHCTKPHLADTIQSLNQPETSGGAPPLTVASQAVHHLYACKKEALVHADLHCNNILWREADQDVKVIDAEKFYMGPCGIDVGQAMANFAVRTRRCMEER